MSRVDLHIHSTVSDGRFTPAEVVRKAAARGLSAMALADHDAVEGIVPALEEAKNHAGLTMIPAVEINTDVPTGEIHVLGYFFDYMQPELLNKLALMRESRVNRGAKMVEKLRLLGLNVEWKRVQEIAGAGSIGRPHIAEALLEKGYISNIKEAFIKYIGWGGPAYVEREKMTPAEAAELILKANGLPVLAHPLTINNHEATIIELKDHGLAGIEAYYGNYSPDQVKNLVALAKKYSLLTTGGSDYHGLDETSEVLIGSVDVPDEVVDKLTAKANASRGRDAAP
jgi:3',5'-nucleoside bisphosphate phosphatase